MEKFPAELSSVFYSCIAINVIIKNLLFFHIHRPIRVIGALWLPFIQCYSCYQVKTAGGSKIGKIKLEFFYTTKPGSAPDCRDTAWCVKRFPC